VAQQVWRFADEQAHELEKHADTDRYFAACIRVAASNLMSMLKLSSPYMSESGAIFRNLLEACIDFFWVASFSESQPDKCKRLAENFFLYGKAQFVENAPAYSKLCKSDPFLRDIKGPFDDIDAIEQCRKDVGARVFGNSWRYDPAIFADEAETRWKARSQIAAAFVEKAVRLKQAPYLANLRALSSYSHFDPAQLSQSTAEFRDRLFDRDINIAIGFVFDMLMFSYRQKMSQPPQALVVLQHQFLWFST
jgi:hypothetical protein